MVAQPQHLSGDHINFCNAVNLIAKQFNADSPFTGPCRQHLNAVAPHTKCAAMKVDIVALILNIHQLAQNSIPIMHRAHPQRQRLFAVFLRRTYPINTGHTGYNNHVPPLQQRCRSRVTHFFNLLINLRILLYICIGGRHIGFRLIIIVIADKVFHCIFRKKLLKLTVQLRRQRFIVGNDQRRPIGFRNDIGHGKGFTRTGHTQHNLLGQARIQPIYQLSNGLGLITGRFIF